MLKFCLKALFPQSFGRFTFPLIFHTRKLGEILLFYNFTQYYTAWKGNVFGVILVRVFPHLNWMRTRITSNKDTFDAVPTIQNNALHITRQRCAFRNLSKIYYGAFLQKYPFFLQEKFFMRKWASKDQKPYENV